MALKENFEAKTIEMKPGDFVGYSSEKKASSLSKSKTISEPITSWKSGYFYFNRTPLSEVIEMVEATHGIKIKVGNSDLLKETITGKVPSEKSDKPLV